MNKKIIRISEQAHLRSDFRKKSISLGRARTHECIISSGQKFFVRFLVQVKTAKSPFEINLPLMYCKVYQSRCSFKFA